jgi:hypothetical protein
MEPEFKVMYETLETHNIFLKELRRCGDNVITVTLTYDSKIGTQEAFQRMRNLFPFYFRNWEEGGHSGFYDGLAHTMFIHKAVLFTKREILESTEQGRKIIEASKALWDVISSDAPAPQGVKGLGHVLRDFLKSLDDIWPEPAPEHMWRKIGEQ